MIGHDEGTTFVPVGRIGVGTGRVVRDGETFVVTARLRDHRGAVESLAGRAIDLPGALAGAIASLAKQPFVVVEAAASTEPGDT